MAAQTSLLPTRKLREAVGISVGPCGREIKGRRPYQELQLVEPLTACLGALYRPAVLHMLLTLVLRLRDFLNLELLLLG
jgi:hypothetical protein